jgi:hypothetical protein
MNAGRRGRWAVLFVVAVGGMALAGRFWPRERLLLQRATWVANVEDWYGDYEWHLGCYWLSDREILHERFTGNPNSPQRAIYRRNIATGAETIQPALTKLLNAFDGNRVHSTVSPDGKWLVCSSRFGDTLLVELNTGRHYTYEGYGYKSISWMADSRHWVEEEIMNEDETLYLRDVEKPTVTQERVLPKNSLLHDYHYEYELGYIQTSDRALLSPWPNDTDKTHQVEFLWCRLPDSAKPVSKVTVRFPDGARCRNISISPNGDRVAWEFHFTQKSPLVAWLHRLIPRVPAEPQQVFAIWVSRLDGGEMHEVGHLLSGKEAEDDDSAFGLDWLPGGKRLSFGYDDALYTVPAD